MFVTLVQLSYDGYDVHSCLLCVAGLLVWFHLLVTFLTNTNPSINSQHTQHNQQTHTSKKQKKIESFGKKIITISQRTIGWGSTVGAGAGAGGWCDWSSTGSATVTPSWLNSDHICTTTNNNPNNHNNKHTRSPITRARNRSQKGMQHSPSTTCTILPHTDKAPCDPSPT